MKTKKIFKKFTIIYFSLLALLCCCFLYYVIDSLIKYENSDIEKYISNLVVDISGSARRNRIDKYLDINDIKIGEYEVSNVSVSEAYQNIFKTKKITYQLVGDALKENPTYDIFADDELLFTIKLKSLGNIQRMGLLSFPDWQIDKIALPEDRGVYYYNIYTLDSYTVKVNEKIIKSNQAQAIELDSELEELSDFTELPHTVKYEINNLTTEAKIQIFDENNKEVNYNKIGRDIEAYQLFTTDDVQELNEKLVEEMDILAISEMWSKFLTDDLAGYYHGYSTIKNYLIEDTHLWDMAYEWAHGVDITFVSGHTLVGFDNENVSNCTLYNKNAFSCEVYLEKNMRLRSGKAKQDIMHDKMYFVYYQGAWKLISMKAITDSNVES